MRRIHPFHYSAQAPADSRQHLALVSRFQIPYFPWPIIFVKTNAFRFNPSYVILGTDYIISILLLFLDFDLIVLDLDGFLLLIISSESFSKR